MLFSNKQIVFAVLGALVVYKSIDNKLSVSTKKAGDVLSDIDARLHGWSPVQLTDLVISKRYLNSDYTLKSNAANVLIRVDKYKPILFALFGSKLNMPMSVNDRSMIGKKLQWNGCRVLVG
ncbi:hypothetical protein C0Z01_14135 [Photobacterium kishitanii]|uniref:hypothetical protein n=1 Tax=Photobacterium kishitanii TaxID=318456 RepID=UPI0007EF1BE8|nr:hypothetical protein [Photobacterium kishitanii]OBU24950.1 hypothetical protein AYY22_20980 [Photobacterium kishitanii]PSW68696.1 hypothetical protein C0Z01_14135 [Photobacterium kishitanii]